MKRRRISGDVFMRRGRAGKTKPSTGASVNGRDEAGEAAAVTRAYRMRAKRRRRGFVRRRGGHDRRRRYKITVSCKQRISSARLMAAWVAVGSGASRVSSQAPRRLRASRAEPSGRISSATIAPTGVFIVPSFPKFFPVALISPRIFHDPPTSASSRESRRGFPRRLLSSRDLSPWFIIPRLKIARGEDRREHMGIRRSVQTP